MEPTTSNATSQFRRSVSLPFDPEELSRRLRVAERVQDQRVGQIQAQQGPRAGFNNINNIPVGQTGGPGPGGSQFVEEDDNLQCGPAPPSYSFYAPPFLQQQQQQQRHLKDVNHNNRTRGVVSNGYRQPRPTKDFPRDNEDGEAGPAPGTHRRYTTGLTATNHRSNRHSWSLSSLFLPLSSSSTTAKTVEKKNKTGEKDVRRRSVINLPDFLRRNSSTAAVNAAGYSTAVGARVSDGIANTTTSTQQMSATQAVLAAADTEAEAATLARERAEARDRFIARERMSVLQPSHNPFPAMSSFSENGPTITSQGMDVIPPIWPPIGHRRADLHDEESQGGKRVRVKVAGYGNEEDWRGSSWSQWEWRDADEKGKRKWIGGGFKMKWLGIARRGSREENGNGNTNGGNENGNGNGDGKEGAGEGSASTNGNGNGNTNTNGNGNHAESGNTTGPAEGVVAGAGAGAETNGQVKQGSSATEMKRTSKLLAVFGGGNSSR